MSQSWNPERYARTARFVAELGMPVLELLKPKPGERILDLGCGDGALTAKLAELGCEVVGVDASTEQVEAARARGLEAYVMDGQKLTFNREFDAVFSNAALHWMRDADAVISGVHRALRPGGRFVAELGGRGNIETIYNALWEALEERNINAAAIDPWYFPSVDDYSDHLAKGGFKIKSIDLIPRLTPLPGDIGDWLETFAETFLKALYPSERPDVIAEVREAVRPALYRNEQWVADYVRLRFAAVKYTT